MTENNGNNQRANHTGNDETTEAVHELHHHAADTTDTTDAKSTTEIATDVAGEYWAGDDDAPRPVMLILSVAEKTLKRDVTLVPRVNIPIDETHFPDPVLRSLVTRFDTNGDGVLSPAENARATILDYDYIRYASRYHDYGRYTDAAGEDHDEEPEPIEDTTGIKWLAALTEIRLNGLQATTIDLSNAMKLQNLEIVGSALTSIDLTHNRFLTRVDLSLGNTSRNYPRDWSTTPDHGSQLTTVTLGEHPHLTTLYLNRNKVETLNLTGCPNLIEVDLSDNQLTAVTISNHLQLENADLSGNQLTEITVHACPLLDTLNLKNNHLDTVDVHECDRLRHLPLTGNPGLKKITLPRRPAGYAKITTGLKTEKMKQIVTVTSA